MYGELKIQVQIAVKKLIESSMEYQIQDLIGTTYRWEHKYNRGGYRNGYYSRDLLTSFGYIGLRVPRIREEGVNFALIKKYQRRTKDVDEHILQMFLAGVSTRRVEEVIAPLYGEGRVSAGLVSKITKILSKQVDKFHNRRLKDKYGYLILDGIYLNAKSPVYKKRRCILVAMGIWLEGDKIRRELIDYQIASKGESENAWTRFLNGLYYRGLEGDNVKLIAMDGNEGLKNAMSTVYPRALPQRCWAHKLRNVSDKLPRKYQEECIKNAGKIYNAESYSAALYEFKCWVKEWERDAPKAVECLSDDIEELLNFYKCPEKLWIKLRTTNAIERNFREVRRRTRTMSCFQNTESVERIIYAIFCRMNRKWDNKDYEYLEDSIYEITQTC